MPLKCPPDKDDNNEVSICVIGPNAGAGGPPLIIMQEWMMVKPENDDDTHDHVPQDPAGGQHGPRGLRGGHGPIRPKRPMGPVILAFMNLHVKCLIFSEEHVVKCGLFCLILGDDAHLWYKVLNPMDNNWNILQIFFLAIL